METVLSIPVSILAWPILLTIFAMGIPRGSDKWESEDQAQYEHFNPRVKTVREVHRKEPTLPQTKNSAVTESKSPLKVAVADDLGKTNLVHKRDGKKAYFCFENQSVAEARRIMREKDLQ